jgi:hypothetical protein
MTGARREAGWKVVGCLGLLLAGLHIAVGHRLQLSRWRVEPQNNAALDEALAWKAGTLELSHSSYEVAEVGGRRLNVVGLAFTIISVAATTLTGLAGGGWEEFFPAYYVAIVFLPLPLLAFRVFLRQTGSAPWAAVLAFYLLAATPLLPVLQPCRGGSIYYINHALAVTGLLLITDDLLGPRRIWPAVLGLALAGWSRQMTCLYAIPVLLASWSGGTDAQQGANGAGRRRRLAMSVAGVLVVAGVPAALNWLKFGHPLDTGYPRIYEGRTDRISRRAQDCFYGPRYVPMHLWAMNLATPGWDIRGGALYPVTDETDGGSLWLTSPLLVGVFLWAGGWWTDRRRRTLMLCTLPVVVGLWGYHTTGSQESGFYRYALDYLPVWLVVIAPWASGPRARTWTLACLGFGAVYFSLLPVL